jgi:hypothetical protein
MVREGIVVVATRIVDEWGRAGTGNSDAADELVPLDRIYLVIDLATLGAFDAYYLLKLIRYLSKDKQNVKGDFRVALPMCVDDIILGQASHENEIKVFIFTCF